MLSRALILATVTFLLGCFGTTFAVAQNLEAGKPPSQIFSSTCSLCHKGARGLLKSVAPGSLPGFLRQHYTTSSDMAAAMSAYVLSNGAANAPVAGGNLTKQGQEAKSAPKPSVTPDGRPEQAARDRKPPTREASRPDIGQDGAAPLAPDAATLTARQKAVAERKAARQAARDKAAGKGEPAPKIDARHEPSAKDDVAASAKTDAPKTEPSAPETGKTETAKVDGTRADPVPAVTPAPKDEKPAAAVASLPPKDDAPAASLTIDIGPPKTPVAAVATPSGPPPVRAGAPVPPISR